MNTVFLLFLRRIRAPLIVLIGAYTLSITGLVLLPGVDEQGNTWYFDFFHAFYFVSFMGSTIGFGEIPYPFSPAQRLWTTAMIYCTVIAWLYAIGKILGLIQDQALRRAITEQRFIRQVKAIRQPFYLICGYGETGSLLVKALNRRLIQTVVVDKDPERINALELADLSSDVPALCADADLVLPLQEAGLNHPQCKAVIALTNNEDINLKVAITSKLLRQELKVICRANTESTTANLHSFNTDHIINPFTLFADHLAMTLRMPSVHLLYEWLIRVPGLPLPKTINPPRGTWIICGFGRFGQAVHRYLNFEGISTVIIEPDPQQAPADAIIGRGTEAVTLREAGIDKAVGIVAGSDNDSNNLSIIMTARELKSDLYLLARQNRRSNDAIFAAADIDLIMQASRIIAWRILPLLNTPLLSRFLHLARHRNEDWSQALLQRIASFCKQTTPLTWSLRINAEQTPALHHILQLNRPFYLDDLLRDPRDREHQLPGIVLLLSRDGEEILLPEQDQQLQPDDELLLCTRQSCQRQIYWALSNHNILTYIITGKQYPDGYIWRWWTQQTSQ